jgi:uncharacterized protein (DUF4213/DUF364 family)
MTIHPIYDVLLERTASTSPVSEVLIGLTWILCQVKDGGLGLAMSPGLPTRTLPWSGTLVGKQVAELASQILSWNPYETTVAMAAINAVINHDNPMLQKATAIQSEKAPANLAVFEWFKPMLQAKRTVVVGRYPGLERYTAELDLTVLERQPEADDLPDPACEYLLPDADWVFLTATSIPNKTFPRLAELAKNAKLVLMGPTVPWLPELFEFGVDYLAGIRVEQPDKLRQAIAEGGGTRIFECGARYCVTNLEPGSRNDRNGKHCAA